MANSN